MTYCCTVGESCISPALILAASNDKCYNVLPPIPSKVQVNVFIILCVLTCAFVHAYTYMCDAYHSVHTML